MNDFDILKEIGGVFLLLIGFSIVVAVLFYLLASVFFAIRFVVGVLKDASKDESSEEVGSKKQTPTIAEMNPKLPTPPLDLWKN